MIVFKKDYNHYYMIYFFFKIYNRIKKYGVNLPSVKENVPEI